MEETRQYLFCRLEHTISVLRFLYGETGEVQSILQKESDFDPVENVFLALSRRSAYLPSQIDGSLLEAARILANLRELNSVAVKLTGGLKQPPAQVRVASPPFLHDPPPVEPTRALRPAVKSAKSASDLRNQIHPAHRLNQRKSYNQSFPPDLTFIAFNYPERERS